MNEHEKMRAQLAATILSALVGAEGYEVNRGAIPVAVFAADEILAAVKKSPADIKAEALPVLAKWRDWAANATD